MPRYVPHSCPIHNPLPKRGITCPCPSRAAQGQAHALYLRRSCLTLQATTAFGRYAPRGAAARYRCASVTTRGIRVIALRNTSGALSLRAAASRHRSDPHPRTTRPHSHRNALHSLAGLTHSTRNNALPRSLGLTARFHRQHRQHAAHEIRPEPGHVVATEGVILSKPASSQKRGSSGFHNSDVGIVRQRAPGAQLLGRKKFKPEH